MVETPDLRVDPQSVRPRSNAKNRIAAVLDQADELRARRRASLALLDDFTKSVFVDMFGSPPPTPVTVGLELAAHPRGWRWEELTEVARLATGHTPDRERSEYWDGGIPWISLTEIRHLDGRVATRTELAVSAEGIRHSSAVVHPPGTVCFSRTASIGFVTVMGTEMATSQDFVNWICGDRLDPTYLMHALLMSRTRLRALSSGSTHKTIYMRVAEQFRVLVPPVDLQREFAAQVEESRKVRAAHGAHFRALDALFVSLQHQAFAGQL
jgi:type I restriction enzyme S subunit